MSRELLVTPHLRIPHDEFQWQFVRSAGPGGQNVNKVNSKAVLLWPITASPSLSAGVRERFLAKFGKRINSEGIFQLGSQRYRDQARNVADCLEKLRVMLLEIAAPPVKRKPPRITAAMRARRLETKRQQAVKKQRRTGPSLD